MCLATIGIIKPRYISEDRTSGENLMGIQIFPWSQSISPQKAFPLQRGKKLIHRGETWQTSFQVTKVNITSDGTN